MGLGRRVVVAGLTSRSKGNWPGCRWSLCCRGCGCGAASCGSARRGWLTRDNALADITVATEVDEVAILNDTTVADWARSPCATSPPSGRCCCWRPTTSAPDTSRSGA